MKLVVHTEFADIDEQWLDWYLKRLRGPHSQIPNAQVLVDKLERDGEMSFTSEDPSHSSASATTTYILEPNEPSAEVKAIMEWKEKNKI